MTPIAIAVLSVSLSADAFAAAVGRGASQRPGLARALKTGAVFGSIEAITPVLGWALGLAASDLLQRIDHWIAFALLGAVGIKMVWEATRQRAPDTTTTGKGTMGLVAVAIGTSIDAAAVGVSLALLSANIVVVALAIGCTTFVMASLGMIVGRMVGARLGRFTEVAGGLLLIGLGSLILFEHLHPAVV